jgi:hypothetical protein
MSREIGPREKALREMRERGSVEKRISPQFIIDKFKTTGKKPIKRKQEKRK